MKKGALIIFGLLTILFVSFFVSAHTAFDLNIGVGSNVETLQQAYNDGDLMGTRSSYASGSPLDPGHDAAQIWVSVQDYPTGTTLLNALKSTNKLCPASTPQYPTSTGMPNPGHFGYDIQTSSGYNLQDAINNYQFCCFNNLQDCAAHGKNCGNYYKCGGSTTTKELSCGTTPSGQVCNNGVLCAPNCKNADGSARVCGGDTCGGSCGSCAPGLICETSENRAYNNVGLCCPERNLVGQTCGTPDIGTACQSAYKYNVPGDVAYTSWAGVCSSGKVCDTTPGSSTIGTCLACAPPKVLTTDTGFLGILTGQPASSICCDAGQKNVGGSCCGSNTGTSCGGNSCVSAGTIACNGICAGMANISSGTSCGDTEGDTRVCDGKGNCVSSIPTTTPTNSSTTTSVTGCTKCANEGGTCSFSGTYAVLYGAPNSYNTKSLTGGTQCTNAVFGDPLVGTVKACYICSIVTTTAHEGGQKTTVTTPVTTCQVCSQGTPIPITSPLWMSVQTSATAYQQAQAAGSTQPDAQAIADAAAASARANPTFSPTAGAGIGPGTPSSISPSANPTSSPTAGAGIGPGSSSTASSSSAPVPSGTLPSLGGSTQGVTAGSSSTAAYVASTLDPSLSVLQSGGTNYVIPTTAQQSGSNDVGAASSGGGGGGGGGGGSVSLPLMKYATK